jgi:hypothetical protein
MALPIKETPVLKGRDADRFIKRMCRAETHPAPKKEYDRAKRIYEQMKQKNKIDL